VRHLTALACAYEAGIRAAQCPPELTHSKVLVPHIIRRSHHVLHIIPAKPRKAAKSLHNKEVLFELAANLISAVLGIYPIDKLTIPKWSLHPLAVFGAPPLHFSLSFRAKTHAVQATGLKPVSDWWPAACCCRKHSTRISSSAGFHEAFLREAARVIGVAGIHCTQSVCCDTFSDPKLATLMFSLLPDRDIMVRYVGTGYRISRSLKRVEDTRESRWQSELHSVTRSELLPSSIVGCKPIH
jgi:hypothetical protein